MAFLEPLLYPATRLGRIEGNHLNPKALLRYIYFVFLTLSLRPGFQNNILEYTIF